MATSIKQNAQTNGYRSALPNFGNLGVLLRILIIVNVIALLAVVIKAPSLAAIGGELLETFSLVQPLLILTLVVLMALNPVLTRMPYSAGVAMVLVLVLVLTTVLYHGARHYVPVGTSALDRYWVIVAMVTGLLLVYFNLRGRALSPAIAEARLQALQARIRPHFLFNSINAVLSLVRQEPRRAEAALEDMADLFRVLMADNRELTPLAREVELCRQYLDLEKLRLGERLGIEWHIDKMPKDALVPPLVLQPLLENAVYHGIEPRTEPGAVSINIYSSRDQVHAVLRNPYSHDGNHHGGNKMALANIRERLQLHFDAEASLNAKVGGDFYEVHIVMPYQREKSA